LAEQGEIVPVPIKGKRTIPVIDFVEKDKDMNEVRPMLSGVYHDGGYAVATDSVVLLSRKEDCDESLEGKVTDKNGNVVAVRFLEWRKFFSPENSYSAGIDANALHAFVRGYLQG